MPEEREIKRRRVTQACENCRLLKAKCNGRRPVCNRCEGYGHVCRWGTRNTRLHEVKSCSPGSGNETLDANGIAALHRVLQTSQDHLRQLRDKLDLSDKDVVDSILALKASVSTPPTVVNSSPRSSPKLTTQASNRRSIVSDPRYLGQVSDVSFFNSIKGLLRYSPMQVGETVQLESYERESAQPSEAAKDCHALHLPEREEADRLIDIYFSTIHVAYPFVCQQHFMEQYEAYWVKSRTSQQSSGFESLLLTIFAIGSYYNDCALEVQSDGAMHEIYSRRAMSDSCQPDQERSLDNVCLLLAQCFYLLATCQTDRCWLTLGLVIRISQTLGLHVEDGQSPGASSRIIIRELRRRTWYSAYVLDRLLSLQLGRPSAIRNGDCNVRLPSRVGDDEFDFELNTIPIAEAKEPKQGDYFIAVIQFSHILGRVMRDLYRPITPDHSGHTLDITEALDAELVNWRAHLPRWLRFDRGHTFENNSILKRQRNMLAMKFHHLRALIHRPYLCLPWLTRNDDNLRKLLDTQSHRVVRSERICVSEAQETAHMLHDVVSKRSLVEDFPWWQMISCLTCASCILLVMRAFSSPTSSKDGMQLETLEEDADTCLKVFDALSTNSDAARRARDMLRDLRQAKVQSWETQCEWLLDPNTTIMGCTSDSVGSVLDNALLPPSLPGPLDAESPQELFDRAAQAGATSIWNWQGWPSEMADSMAWSSRFLETVDPDELWSE